MSASAAGAAALGGRHAAGRSPAQNRVERPPPIQALGEDADHAEAQIP
ncbi:hypothetical protein [Phenylobacterium sp.]|nr:hypothetical protein [Phenylobacterium sp.]MBX3482723.1 hypothetical protein [Phenylobacterium sp.]